MLRAGSIAICLVLGAPLARAAEPPARESATLVYERKPGAENCLDAPELQDQVAGHLGYQPFVDDARLVAKVAIVKRGQDLVAEIQLFEKPNNPVGRRTLKSTGGDCRELGASLALALSIAIDPLSVGEASDSPRSAREPAEAAPAPPKRPPPSAPPPHEPPVVPPPKRPEPRGSALVPRFGLGAHASFGTAPGPAAGAWLYAGAELSRFSVGLEGRADLPVTESAVPHGEVTSSLYLVSLLPCVRHAFLEACASASFGALHASGDGVSDPQEQTTFYSSVGGRVGVNLALTRRVALTAFGGLGATLTRTTLELNDREVWKTPVLIGIGGVGAVFEFVGDDGKGRDAAIR